MRIALLSDTHGFIDPHTLNYLHDVDEIWHAGDIGNKEILDQLNQIKPTKAVFGNIDSGELLYNLPEYIFMEINSCKILMIHIAGKMGTYNKKTNQLITQYKPDILICGHSHILKVAFDAAKNLLYMNPGAAGNHGFHQEKTMLKFEINNKKPENLFLIKLGTRGK